MHVLQTRTRPIISRGQAIGVLMKGSMSTLTATPCSPGLHCCVWAVLVARRSCWGQKDDLVCVCPSVQSLQAGGSLKQLVTLVGAGET